MSITTKWIEDYIQRIRIYLEFEKVVKISYYCIFRHFSTLFVIKIIITYVKKT